jgi:hypothetical protein
VERVASEAATIQWQLLAGRGMARARDVQLMDVFSSLDSYPHKIILGRNLLLITLSAGLDRL